MTQRSIRFSVVTPTYNRRPVLERAIRSVQAQTCSDYEHLIVDDGSTDSTRDYVKSLRDPRIRFIELAEHRGANWARNVGIEAARSSWITFLDSDDEFLPHRLQWLSLFCTPQADVRLLLSSFETHKRQRRVDAVNPALLLSGTQFEQALMGYGICIAGTSITVRRDHLLAAGGFDPTIFRLQDREVLLRLSRLGGAQLLSNVDWVKHPSVDSISLPREGYVEALGELLRANPELCAKYREITGYHVTRHLLSDLFRGRWSQAWSAYRANRRAAALRFGLWELVRGYRTAASQRRAWSVTTKHRPAATNLPLALPTAIAEPARISSAA